MISDREFGELSQQVKHLTESLREVRVDVHTIDEKVDGIHSRFDRIDGGWKVLMFLGGLAGIAGSILTTILIKIWPLFLGTLPKV